MFTVGMLTLTIGYFLKVDVIEIDLWLQQAFITAEPGVNYKQLRATACIMLHIFNVSD